MNADDLKVETFACVFDAIADTPEAATELRTRADLTGGITARQKPWDVPRGEGAQPPGRMPPPRNHPLRWTCNIFPPDDLMTAAARSHNAPEGKMEANRLEMGGS